MTHGAQPGPRRKIIILLKMLQNLGPRLFIFSLSSLPSSFPSFILCVYYTRVGGCLPMCDCCRGHRSKSDVFLHHSLLTLFLEPGSSLNLFYAIELERKPRIMKTYPNIYFVQFIKSQISKHLSSTAILHIGKSLEPMFSHIPYTNGFDCPLAM